MAETPRRLGNKSTIAVVGNYLPRLCGIATFTTDIVESLSAVAPEVNCWSIAINDKPDGYDYSEKVRFEIDEQRLQDYSDASAFLNINQVDIVCVQHEYGIFGGPAGSHILQLLADLRMPVVTTLHTVLEHPSPEEFEVLRKLGSLSDKLVVMSRKAIGFLQHIYKVPPEKIAFIHHGIPDIPFIDPNYYKDKFGVEGKKVILTFGLLSPSKGIESVIRALPAIIEQNPELTYIVLGATHPHVLDTHGEEYRLNLQQLARKLGVSEYIKFENRFVELKQLCEYLGTADIYVTPYLGESQITSGTLAYAMGAGKAVVSTPYWYASEMLAEGRGILVPFNDPEAMAASINQLFADDVQMHSMRKRAYEFTRLAVWKEVAKAYLDVFSEVQLHRSQHPRPRHLYIEGIKSITRFELPKLRLDHMKILTDDTGILQHAIHTIPDRFHGYCTDDNARALLVATFGQNISSTGSNDYDELITTYLSFIRHAFNEKNGRFRNFMIYDRAWMEEVGSEDSHGRALWGLGKAVQFFGNPGHVAVSTMLFKSAIGAVDHFQSPRALALSIVGIHAYLDRFAGDSTVRGTRDVIANRLYDQFTKNASDNWPWLEESLNYANGKLPHALLLCGRWMQREDMKDMGLRALRWLVEIQTVEGHFSPIGNAAWFAKGGSRSRFDQQPIEAQAMIEACIEAFGQTRERFWLDSAVMCLNWFLGDNDLNMALYDPKNGGCRDGLMADGVNQNEGAESTLAWLLSLLAMQKVLGDEVLKQPTEQLPT